MIRISPSEARALSRSLLPGLPGRVAALALLFAFEWKIALVGLHDISNLRRNSGLTGLISDFLAWRDATAETLVGTVLRTGVTFCVLYLTFGVITSKRAFERISSELVEVRISARLFAAHFCCLAGLGYLSWVLFGRTGAGWEADLVAAGWLATGITTISLGVLALVPARVLSDLVYATRSLIGIAGLGGIAAACLVADIGRPVWQAAIGLTFSLVRLLLLPFIPDLIAIPGEMAIGSSKFTVIIFPVCSGIEGAGLMLVFSVLWLWFFRRECRFPHALVLIPAGVVLMWVLNGIRIAALILIGHAGAPEVAMGGFHSQAGWLAFNAAALGFSLTLRRVSWLTVQGPHLDPADESVSDNPTAWYLTPFLTILVASMVTHAATDGFEWLYPLRFFAAAAALWCFRWNYRNLDWRIGWPALAAGAAVFVLWLGMDLIVSPAPDRTIATGLASLPAPARFAWIAFRVLAATLTVPIAEELAFRGFLLRRLIAPDFEQVVPGRFTLFAILASSIAFGVLHGDRWLAGTLAGVVYALAFRHHNRFGDAVGAHAVTNALLAGWVIATGSWQLW